MNKTLTTVKERPLKCRKDFNVAPRDNNIQPVANTSIFKSLWNIEVNFFLFAIDLFKGPPIAHNFQLDQLSAIFNS